MGTPHTPFFRVRWTLRPRAAWAVHSYQHAILYALLCDAARGPHGDGPTHLPDGLLLDAPETARDRWEVGEPFAFGATLVEADPAQASRKLHRISHGLARVGAERPKKPVAVGGNFDLVAVEDLVAGRVVGPDEPFTPLPPGVVSTEIDRLGPRLGQPITLRFLSPLRLELPADHAADGHRYADGSCLLVGQWLRAVQKRLAAVGLRRAGHDADPLFADDAITLVENRLVWLDLEYGRRDRRKALGGALGRVRVAVHDPAALAAVVWGQYTRVGRNLHFGFGRYRVEELGPDPVECRRAVPLLDWSFTPARLAGTDAEPDAVRAAADGLRVGSYAPAHPHRLVLRDADGGTRDLLVPSRTDRAVQRLLLARLGPACDRLFETSSFAWRKGLSRDSAARRIHRLVSDGWHFAVRADFDQFFDRVPHATLEDRLDAWLGDDAASAAVMAFVRAGTPPGVGLPTGAPLSPLLGNLLLDRFDEQIEADGGRLVRYADDFLILCRTREDADRLHRRSHALAADLLIRLNDDAAVLDLREPFDFLGFLFRHEERWHYAGPAGPRRVRELGWQDADRTPLPVHLPLPGEEDAAGATGVIVAGPGLDRIDVVGAAVHLLPMDAAAERRLPLDGVERLIVLGPVAWSADAPGKLLRAGVPVQFVSEGGWPLGELTADTSDDPDVILAQCRAATDPVRTLVIARGLVAAKLRNFATLLTATGLSHEAAVAQLHDLAAAAPTAGTLDALRGLEGAGAAAWYRRLPGLLGPGFTFFRRVSPDATDPVNVLLNIGHTVFHRHAVAAARAAGLTPAVGFLHSSTPRYPALAADLQEPFRHLVERAVILATRRLRPAQFRPQDDGAYPLRLEPSAAKLFHAVLQRSFRAAVVGRGQTEPRAWLGQLLATARGLRRHLLNPDTPWEPFEHP